MSDTQALAEVVPIEQELVADDLPIVPGYREVRDLAAMAVTLSHADCVPGPLRGKPNSVFMVLLAGRDLGIKLTVALRMLHVIDGQVTVPPKLKLALVRERKLGRVWPDPANNAESATWYAVRHDDPGVTYTSTVTIEQARSIKLTSTKKLTDKDNWQNYPDRMLSWRALGYLLDDAFSEVATGLYSPDEIGAITDEEGVPLEVVDVDPFPGMKGASRREEAITAQEAGELLTFIGSLPEAGRDVLRKAWKEKGLPPPQYLTASRMGTVNALVEWVDKRARGGEWGPWPPQPQSDPDDPPAAPSNDEPAADGTTAAPEQPPGDPPRLHLADPAMCLHPDTVELEDGTVCVACGERQPS